MSGGGLMPYCRLEKKKAIKDQDKKIKQLNVGYVLIKDRLVDIRER